VAEEEHGAGWLSRRHLLLGGLTAPVASNAPLAVRREGESLRVTAPQIHFLNGRPLEQLRNGASLGFASQVVLYTDPLAPLSRGLDRFVVSFDLWEEKFSATRLGPPQRTSSRMTAAACEAWCLENLLAVPPGLAPQRRFWIRLELRLEDARDNEPVIGEPGINLTRLIELFSRPPRGQQPRWSATVGPLRLDDLK